MMHMMLERYLHVYPIKKDCVSFMVSQVVDDKSVSFNFDHKATTRYAFPLGDKEPRADAELAQRMTAVTCRTFKALELLGDVKNYHKTHLADVRNDVLTKTAVERAANVIIDGTFKQAKLDEMILLVGPSLQDATKNLSVEQVVEDAAYITSEPGDATEFAFIAEKFLHRAAVLLWLPKAENKTGDQAGESKFHPLTAFVHTDMQVEELSKGPAVIDDYLMAFTAPVCAFLFQNIGEKS